MLMTAASLAVMSCNGTPARPTVPGVLPPAGVRSTGPIAFVSDRDGQSQIYLANADGSAPTRLTEGSNPAWSSNGRTLAFQRTGAVWVINVDGSGLSRLASGAGPSWSPDGAKIAFQVDVPASQNQIVTINADGSGAAVLVTADFASPGSPDWGVHSAKWSPDGHTIAFIRSSWDYPVELWFINADRSEPRRLSNIQGVTGLAWSRDGRTIALEHFAGIHIANADGTHSRLEVPAETMFQVACADWTPDGRLIFQKNTSQDGRGRTRIFTGDFASQQQLIPEASAPVRASYRDTCPVWAR